MNCQTSPPEKIIMAHLQAAMTSPYAFAMSLSVDAHAVNACDRGTSIYLASVAKTPAGVVNASSRLSLLSKKHQFISMMCNCIGTCEGQMAGGGSAVWDMQGEMLTKLE